MEGSLGNVVFILVGQYACFKMVSLEKGESGYFEILAVFSSIPFCCCSWFTIFFSVMAAWYTGYISFNLSKPQFPYMFDEE